jgi:hypothetical protein
MKKRGEIPALWQAIIWMAAFLIFAIIISVIIAEQLSKGGA